MRFLFPINSAPSHQNSKGISGSDGSINFLIFTYNLISEPFPTNSTLLSLTRIA